MAKVKPTYSVDELKTLHGRTTPGEWAVPKRPSIAIADGEPQPGYVIEGPEYVPDYECIYFTKADCEAIVALHNQFPALAADLRRLEAENAALRGALNAKPPRLVVDDLEARISQLEAENAALRDELKSVLDDFNALVRASGSKTNGGAVGHVTALNAERDRLRAALQTIAGINDSRFHPISNEAAIARAALAGPGEPEYPPDDLVTDSHYDWEKP